MRTGVAAVFELNRYLDAGSDELNLSAQIGLEWVPWHSTPRPEGGGPPGPQAEDRS